MSEYTIKVKPLPNTEVEGFSGVIPYVGVDPLERITRCKDCRYWNDVYGECSDWGAPRWHESSPDGFCKWGERRNDGV